MPFIIYMDSLNQVSDVNMQVLRDYLEKEYIDKQLEKPAERSKFFTKEYGWNKLSYSLMPHYQPKVP